MQHMMKSAKKTSAGFCVLSSSKRLKTRRSSKSVPMRTKRNPAVSSPTPAKSPLLAPVSALPETPGVLLVTMLVASYGLMMGMMLCSVTKSPMQKMMISMVAPPSLNQMFVARQNGPPVLMGSGEYSSESGLLMAV